MLLTMDLPLITILITLTPSIESRFPFRTFFNRSFTVRNSELYSKYSCQGNRMDRCCSCSGDCMIYGTCCIDKHWTMKWMGVDNDKYISLFRKRFNEADKYLECEEVPFFTPGTGHTSKSYLMVSSCPVGMNTKLRKPCTQNIHYSDKMPVHGDNGFLYKNALCAQCNSVSEFTRIGYQLYCERQNDSDIIDVTKLSLENYNNCRLK